MLTAGGIAKPTFVTDVRGELVRLFRPPRTEIVIIAFNALIVCFGWLTLPTGPKDWLISNLQGPLAFVIVLETWMLGDVTSTNLLAHDVPAALVSLDRLGGVRRLLQVKVVALGLLIGPPCAIIALIIGGRANKIEDAALLTPVFFALPFGTLAVASVLGVFLPYRPRSMRWRWDHRLPLRGTVRWAFLVLVPYRFVSVVVAVLVYPARLLSAALTGAHRTGAASPSTLAVIAVLTCLASAAGYAFGPMVSSRLAWARRGRLIAYFRDPDAG